LCSNCFINVFLNLWAFPEKFLTWFKICPYKKVYFWVEKKQTTSKRFFNVKKKRWTQPCLKSWIGNDKNYLQTPTKGRHIVLGLDIPHPELLDLKSFEN
jgi:hypothetical protein